MSNFFRSAYDPESKTIRSAWWLDNYFGRWEYGVRFDPDGKVFTPQEVDIPTDKVFVEKLLDNSE